MVLHSQTRRYRQRIAEGWFLMVYQNTHSALSDIDLISVEGDSKKLEEA